MKWILSLFALFTVDQALGQIEDSTVFFADVMRHAEMAEHRIWAAEQFKQRLKKGSGRSDQILEVLKPVNQWVSMLAPSDSSFHMVTWQINGKDEVSYEGFIVHNDLVTWLEPNTVSWMEIQYDVFDVKNWPAALYYQIIPISNEEYILLGYNASQPQVNYKIAETISFSGEEIVFGTETFYMDDDSIRPDVRTRIAVQYDKRSSVRMNLDENRNVLFYDHVVPMETLEAVGEVSWMPDGSYEGFEWRDGKWMHNEKLFNTQVDSPPGMGKRDSIRRDILGRPIQR